MRDLIEGGAEVNFVGEMQNTALHKAALMGMPRMVQVLLDNGANKSLVNKEGHTPFDIALRCAKHNPQDETLNEVVNLLTKSAL